MGLVLKKEMEQSKLWSAGMIVNVSKILKRKEVIKR